jgi:hypothetical protein
MGDNRRAFRASILTSLGGMAIGGAALLAFATGSLGGFGFMVLLGLGLYIPYVAVHTTIFERLIALVKDKGNIGYLMYLADAFGYLGYAAVLVARNFLPTPPRFLDFFTPASGVLLTGAAVLMALGGAYFLARPAPVAACGSETPRAAEAR